MKMLVIVCCFVVASFAISSHEKLSAAVADSVHQSAWLVRKRDVEKRSLVDNVNSVCAMIDIDNNGHITGHEFATFFARFDSSKTYDQWKDAFDKSLWFFDTNKNGTYECGEILVTAIYGGAGK